MTARLFSQLDGRRDLLSLIQHLFDAASAGSDPSEETQFLLADEVEQRAKELLGGTHPQGRVLTDRQWEKLEALAGVAQRRRLPEPLLAASLLQALDSSMGRYVPELFEARFRGESVRLGDGSLFPVAARDPRLLLRVGRLSARPSAMQRPRHRLVHFGCLQLARGSRFEVRLDYSAEVALTRFLQNPAVAVVLPHADFPTEFQLTTDLERGRFFDVRPREPEDVLFERLVAALTRASRAGAVLAILPELSVTPAVAERLEHWLESQDRLSVLIAGSFHQRSTDGRWNRCLTFVPGASAPLRHDKFNPYELSSWDGATHMPPLREDLLPGKERLTVYWSRGWSFATLICKDFLDDEALELLSQLRVSFAFVVALSDNSEAFANRARALVARGQTTTFLCNFAGRPGADALGAAAVVPLPQEAVRGARQGSASVFLLQMNDGNSMGWRLMEPG